MKTAEKKLKRDRRHGRIRSKIIGTSIRPRLSVFKSNNFIYAQLIDDENNTTIISADSRKSKAKSSLEKAKEVGRVIAKNAKKKKIEKAVFDRGGFTFIGKVKALADGAREEGLNF